MNKLHHVWAAEDAAVGVEIMPAAPAATAAATAVGTEATAGGVVRAAATITTENSISANPRNEVSVLAGCLWHPAAAATAAAVDLQPSLLLSCLEAPEKVSIHFKDTVHPVLLPQQQHHKQQQQQQQQQEQQQQQQQRQLQQEWEFRGYPMQHLLLRVRGIVTRQQSLGRRLCFFDIMPQQAIAAAAEAAAATRGTATTRTASREAAAASSGGDASAKQNAIATTAAATGAATTTGVAAGSPTTAAATPTETPTTPPSPTAAAETAAAETSIALCCSVSSPDVGGLDVHRSILRRLRSGDSVEAVGVLERKGELQQLQQLASKFVSSRPYADLKLQLTRRLKRTHKPLLS